MNFFITGCNGFVGRYMTNLLLDKSHNVMGCDLAGDSINNRIKYYQLNLDDSDKFNEIFNKSLDLDGVFHFAAMSNPQKSRIYPKESINSIVDSTVNLLEYCRTHPKTKLLCVGSQLEYKEKEGTLSEDDPFEAKSIYASAKIASELIIKQYNLQYGVQAVLTRSFNHMGAYQSPEYVIPSFVKQCTQIYKGFSDPIISVGNLNVVRDLVDVRDVVEAYWELMINGQPGETYNVASGKGYRLSDILDLIVKKLKIKVSVEINEDYLRKNDVLRVVGNIEKIKKDTNWTPQYSLDKSIDDLISYWLEVVDN